MRIFDYIPANRLVELLRRYSGLFDHPVFLLDRERNLILRFPEDAPQTDLNTRPLNMRDSLIGYIAVPAGASEAHLDFIEGNLSGIIEMGYEIDSLSGEVARVYEELSLLWKLSSRLGAGLDVDKICHVLAEEVAKISPSRNISVMLLSDVPSGPAKLPKPVRMLLPKVSLGKDASIASTVPLSPETGLVGYVFEKKEAVTVCDVSKDERFEGLPYPVNRILIVPLMVEGNAIGTIIATDKLNGEEYYTTEIKLISSIASDCAISIKKALLYDEIHRMLFSTAEAFSLAIDAKDPYTYGHSKRVSEITVAVASKMGIHSEQLDWIRLAALLHDTGKIGTPEDVLHKEGGLEPEETDRMKQHPLVGAKMIGHIRRMEEIAQWICHHHEKYDGSGYPSGLKGDEIPMQSRIIAIADYFDALTSDRPYRKAYTREEAVGIMRKSVGTHFDPVIFDYFEKVVIYPLEPL